MNAPMSCIWFLSVAISRFCIKETCDFFRCMQTDACSCKVTKTAKARYSIWLHIDEINISVDAICTTTNQNKWLGKPIRKTWTAKTLNTRQSNTWMCIVLHCVLDFWLPPFFKKTINPLSRCRDKYRKRGWTPSIAQHKWAHVQNTLAIMRLSSRDENMHVCEWPAIQVH